MSAPDEFDPMIERLYARAPALPDADVFARRVEQRLDRGWSLRTLALGSAGVIGGLIAVRQTLASGLSLEVSGAGPRTDLASAGPAEAWRGLETWLGGGLLGAETGAMGGMQLFWLLTAGLIAAAAVTAVRAVNEG